MLNKILNLVGVRRMIVEPGQTEELFGGSVPTQRNQTTLEETHPVTGTHEKIGASHFVKRTVARGTADFSMPMDAFNSQLG